MEMELQDAERKRARLIASCIVFALISIPLILKIVPPNGMATDADVRRIALSLPGAQKDSPP